MKIICISDSHNRHRDLIIPEGDILIHAGDITKNGTIMELREFNRWLGELSFDKSKILVTAGNHDHACERKPQLAREEMFNCTYLENQGIEINGIKFYLSPSSPRFYDFSFNFDRGDTIQREWDKIPDDIEVLVTHAPPLGILDTSSRGVQVGCANLLSTIQSRLKKLKLHVYGHNHEGYGQEERDGVIYVNAASCNRNYEPVNPPIVIDL